MSVLANMRANGVSPAAIAEIVLAPAFGENERTRALERWLDLHDWYLSQCDSRDRACKRADAAMAP